jgi:hypothetical protein
MLGFCGFSGLEGIGVMKRTLALLVVLVAAGTTLILAGGGGAASPNVCLTSSTATTDASCVRQLVTPHVVTANNDVQTITSFTNESGPGGATASRVLLTVTFPSSVTVKAIKVTVDGNVTFSSAPPGPTTPNPCTPATLPFAATTVTCSIGSVFGGSKANLYVRASTANGGTVTGSANYGERTNDNAGQLNNTQLARDAFSIGDGSTAKGGCFDSSSTTLTGSTSTQSITSTAGPVDPSLKVQCTPLASGIDAAGPRPTGFTPIWFTDFLAINGGGFGTVLVDANFKVPTGFVLRELTGLSPTDANSWTPVPIGCLSSGLPPSGDSCIFDTKNLPKGGLRWILHVTGTLFDSKFAG